MNMLNVQLLLQPLMTDSGIMGNGLMITCLHQFIAHDALA